MIFESYRAMLMTDHDYSSSWSVFQCDNCYDHDFMNNMRKGLPMPADHRSVPGHVPANKPKTEP